MNADPQADQDLAALREWYTTPAGQHELEELANGLAAGPAIRLGCNAYSTGSKPNSRPSAT